MMRHAAQIVTIAFLVVFAAGSALAHPGSGIVVDRSGNVFVLDTGSGLWKVDRSHLLTHVADPRFHWMALDERNWPRESRLPSPAGGEIAAIGSSPTLLVSGDVPLAVGSDAAIYYPEAGADGRLRIVRATRSGARSVRAILPANGTRGPRWINGLAAAPDGSLYYTEDKALRKIDGRGVVTTLAENVSVNDCRAIPGMEAGAGPYLRGLAVAGDGTVLVAASGCGAVLKVTPRGEMTTVLRTTSPWSPTAVAISPNRSMFLSTPTPPLRTAKPGSHECDECFPTGTRPSLLRYRDRNQSRSARGGLAGRAGLTAA